MPAGNFIRALFAAGVIPVLVAGCMPRPAVSSAAPETASLDVLSTTPHVTSTGIVTDFAHIVQRDSPAVVNISAAQGTPVANMTPLWPSAADERDPFIQFFRQFSFGRSIQPLPPLGTLGSGVITSPDGYIITDARVVAGATQIRVKLADRREFKASVVGVDVPSNIALLKIDAHGLPTVKIGTPSDVKVGQWVVSIGAPYGFENTVTAGIISSKARVVSDETYIPLIQTDLTLNAGDSGGPLFDLNGNVVGVNAPVHRTFQGLSFAIPIDAAMRIEQQLKVHGQIEHGHLAVTIQEVSASLARSFGMTKLVGALISSTERNGPSAKAGLRTGDVILKLNGQEIIDSTQLPMAVADLWPGSTVQVEFWRDHRAHQISVVLGRMQDDSLASDGSNVARQTTVGQYGLTVRGLTSEERRRLSVTGGVRVEQSEGPAALAGIRPGDIFARETLSRVSTTLRHQISPSFVMIYKVPGATLHC